MDIRSESQFLASDFAGKLDESRGKMEVFACCLLQLGANGRRQPKL